MALFGRRRDRSPTPSGQATPQPVRSGTTGNGPIGHGPIGSGAAAPTSVPPPQASVPIPWPAVSPADADRIAGEVVQVLTQVVLRHNKEVAAGRWGRGEREVPVPKADQTRALAARLADPAAPRSTDTPLVRTPALLAYDVERAIGRSSPDAASAIQLIVATGCVLRSTGTPRLHALEAVHARTGRPDLLTLQRLLTDVGWDGRQLIWDEYRSAYGARLGRRWPDSDVHPFVAHNLEWILQQPTAGNWQVDERAWYAALGTLPDQPAQVRQRLYEIALGSRKTERAAAQAALSGDPDRGGRVAQALTDSKGETRLIAAHWLTEIADPSVLPQLQAAWRAERQDVVRGALLDALEAIGQDAADYLDPRATDAKAAKVVARGLPATLDWLDWAAVPDVTWAGSGEPVPRTTIQWLCLTAVKAKSPEPDAVLRHYARLLDRAGRERLASHLLGAWIAADLRPVTRAEAERRAAERAAWTIQVFRATPASPYHSMSVEELTAALLPSFLGQPAGSEVASKGLLAVVAACADGQVVAPAERYLRQWYGMRPSQGKALVAMLAWVEDPAATQLVLAVGSRFRTKGIQDEAISQAQALAQRKGWTVDELADRTIPTAGFDDRGVLDLPYGDRVFTAHLKPDLTMVLRDPDGKAIKALPPPRAADDQDVAAESKKAYTAAKKQLKAIATLQSQRLYAALCTERSWSLDDWQTYLLAHPVVGPAVRRLVWVAIPPDAADVDAGPGADLIAFRPLDDGSLTDVEDNEVRLPAGSRIRVAHDTLLTPAQVQAWTQHLADYEVTPLFQQLGRGTYEVTDEVRGSENIADFTGHLVEAFSLRSRATKLGYVRGPAEDGGYFVAYLKRFPTLGIVAEIGFTGNSLPEENRTVALTELGFARDLPDDGRAPMLVGDVPAILVSECWHDMRAIAAGGSGYDPDWSTKTGY